jgi:CO/xanthine dehydrogenase Mo-binding subunit
MERGAQIIGWSQRWKGWGKPVEINGKKRIGLGMTVVAHDSAAPAMTSGAILKVNEDGSADFITPVGEIGNGGVTTQTQVVSEASGIPISDISDVLDDLMNYGMEFEDL